MSVLLLVVLCCSILLASTRDITDEAIRAVELGPPSFLVFDNERDLLHVGLSLVSQSRGKATSIVIRYFASCLFFLLLSIGTYL